ncbi:MAG: putative Holliday junction resolvase [Bacteriovoracaceae bacterium]|jgi:putative Holliday junction resolvase
MDEKLPKAYLNNKHILAIDYGRKFTGISTYNVGRDPFPLTWGRIKYEDDEQLISEVKKIIEDEFIEILVIGVPFFTDGKESTMTRTIKAFIENFKTKTDCEVFTVDETLTTFEAEERMKNDPKYNFKVDLRKIDELCAAIILEQFLKNSSD